MQQVLSKLHWKRRLVQILIMAAFLCAWQFLPTIHFLSSHIKFLDSFFISSPSNVFQELGHLFTGNQVGTPAVWPYLWLTLQATLIGTSIGFVSGAAVGLWLGNSTAVNDVLRPFIVLLNAVPRITLIPVFVLMFGSTLTSSILVAVAVVFFVVFFNAYEGSRSVADHVVQNAVILGASRWQIMYHVRLRYVIAWSLAALPNAVSFGMVSVVTAEILDGAPGMGRLLADSVDAIEASLTFSVVVLLSVVGLILVGATGFLERRWLRWWHAGDGVSGT